MRKRLTYLAEPLHIQIAEKGKAENRITWKYSESKMQTTRYLAFKLKTEVFYCGELNFRGCGFRD